MSPDLVISVLHETMKVSIMVSLPILIFGLVVGIIVGIFQTATQIHEMTLVFIPKLLAVGIALLIFFPWITRVVLDFTLNLLGNIQNYIR